MRKLKLEEIKEIELNMLKHIDKVCRKNSIPYTLAGGTLLGAIRHKGFIPWDDDVDICLEWEDYKRLIDILSSDEKYLLRYDMDKSEYYYDFAKLTDPTTIVKEPNRPNKEKLGIWVDIFPLVGVPQGETFQGYWKKLIKMNSRVFRSTGTNYCYDSIVFKKIIKAILYFPQAVYCKLYGTEYWKNKRRELHELGWMSAANDNIGIIPSAYREKGMFKKQLFENLIDVEFEDGIFKAVRNWDLYLSQLYGDYMLLPPEEERVAGHFEAYYID